MNEQIDGWTGQRKERGAWAGEWRGRTRLGVEGVVKCSPQEVNTLAESCLPLGASHSTWPFKTTHSNLAPSPPTAA